MLVLLIISLNASADDCIPIGKVLVPVSNASISNIQLVHASADSRIVLLGEHHDNAEHHRWQLQMITALHTLNPELVLGFEMFPRKTQPVLDAWVRGELGESEFLKQAGWNRYWKFDANLYLPIFHYARMNQIPMYALNVDRSLIRQVGKQGWAATDIDVLEGVGDPAPASEAYREMLASVFMQHGEEHSNTSKDAVTKTMAMPGFNRFVESQQVWDRAMAEAITKAAKTHPDARVVAMIGSGHMMYHFGVPEQLLSLSMPRAKVLIPWDPEFECDYLQADFADAVIGLKTTQDTDEGNEKPKLGVYLDASKAGIVISKVSPGSIAEQMGLKKNDLIMKVAGLEVSKIATVIEVVRSTRLGTWLPITIKRDDELIDLIAKFPPKSRAAN